MERRQQMQKWLAVRERDGLTYRELSVRVGVPANSLCQWAWRLRHEAAAAVPKQRGFVQLTVAGAANTPSPQRIEIVLRSKRRVIVDAQMEPLVLTRLLAAIEQC